VNTFTSYDDVPLGAHIVRTTGKRKGWCLQRVVSESELEYQGPTFHCEATDEVFEDWDLPDDGHWNLLI
jgi:hypothetical protein